MLKIILATSNPHKVEEINAISKDYNVEFVMPPEGFNPVENADTFEKNALLKAQEAYKLTGMPSFGDDSGLCVDALNGGPGIYSARYADTPTARIEKLLKVLKDIPENKRGAKFVCAVAFVGKKGETLFLDRGECYGEIGFESKGKNGFGYDPVFIVEGRNVTMAELPEDIKNTISHRAVALNKFFNFLSNNNIFS